VCEDEGKCPVGNGKGGSVDCQCARMKANARSVTERREQKGTEQSCRALRGVGHRWTRQARRNNTPDDGKDQGSNRGGEDRKREQEQEKHTERREEKPRASSRGEEDRRQEQETRETHRRTANKNEETPMTGAAVAGKVNVGPPPAQRRPDAAQYRSSGGVGAGWMSKQKQNTDDRSGSFSNSQQLALLHRADLMPHSTGAEDWCEGQA